MENKRIKSQTKTMSSAIDSKYTIVIEWSVDITEHLSVIKSNCKVKRRKVWKKSKNEWIIRRYT